MKIFFLIIILVLCNQTAIAWTDANKKTWFESCLTSAVDNVSYERAIEYCACTTNEVIKIFTVKKIIQLQKTQKNLLLNKKMNNIINYCNAN